MHHVSKTSAFIDKQLFIDGEITLFLKGCTVAVVHTVELVLFPTVALYYTVVGTPHNTKNWPVQANAVEWNHWVTLILLCPTNCRKNIVMKIHRHENIKGLEVARESGYCAEFCSHQAGTGGC